MSESFVNPLFGQHPVPTAPASAPGAAEHEGADEGPGNPDVDAVVGSLAVLDDLPVGEHVAVFEQAHESLRRTLSGADQGQPAPFRG